VGFSLFKKKSEHTASNFGENMPINYVNQTDFKLGSTIEVRDGEFAVATNSGYVLDVFTPGVYGIVLDRMPKLYNFLRSNKIISSAQGIKKIPVEFYYIYGKELTTQNLLTSRVKMFASNEKIVTKFSFLVNYKIIAPDMYLGFVLKNRKCVKDELAQKLTYRLFKKEISKTIKKQTLDLTENDSGFSKLAKFVETKLTLKKFGIEIISIKFLEFKTNSKTLEHIEFLSNSSKTLDVEFKRFTNAETEKVVLEKVGTESYIDKALPVDVIKGGDKVEDVALLNINTGEDAKKEVVFNRVEEQQIGEEYYNKLDNMLLKPQNSTDNASFDIGGQINVNTNNTQDVVYKDLFCRQCGAKLDPQDKFCGVCGNKIK